MPYNIREKRKKRNYRHIIGATKYKDKEEREREKKSESTDNRSYNI